MRKQKCKQDVRFRTFVFRIPIMIGLMFWALRKIPGEVRVLYQAYNKASVVDKFAVEMYVGFFITVSWVFGCTVVLAPFGVLSIGLGVLIGVGGVRMAYWLWRAEREK